MWILWKRETGINIGKLINLQWEKEAFIPFQTCKCPPRSGMIHYLMVSCHLRRNHYRISTRTQELVEAQIQILLPPIFWAVRWNLHWELYLPWWKPWSSELGREYTPFLALNRLHLQPLTLINLFDNEWGFSPGNFSEWHFEWKWVPKQLLQINLVTMNHSLKGRGIQYLSSEGWGMRGRHSWWRD